MSYSTPVSTQSSTAGSVLSSGTARAFRTATPVTPAMWRRLISFVCPHLDNANVDVEETRLQNLSKPDQVQEEGRLVSGALPKIELFQHNVQQPVCANDFCPTQQQNGSVDLCLKPLPLPPPPDQSPMDRIPAKQHSQFSISSNINAFTKEVDTRFLTPTGQKILPLLQQLPDTSGSPPSVFVNLGEDTFRMPLRDANTLERINDLTKRLSVLQKAVVFEDLFPMLGPQLRYPLQQVLRYGVQIRARYAVAASGDGRESMVEDSRPASLHIRRRREKRTPYPHVLSPLTGITEPLTAQESQHQLEVIPNIEDRKLPGSISQARAGLINSSTSIRRKPVPKPIEPLAAKLLLEESPDKEVEGVRKTRESLFTNPRPAPSPPIKSAEPEPMKEGTASSKKAGSVKSAREGLLTKPGSVKRALDRLYEGGECSRKAIPTSTSVGSEDTRTQHIDPPKASSELAGSKNAQGEIDAFPSFESSSELTRPDDRRILNHVEEEEEEDPKTRTAQHTNINSADPNNEEPAYILQPSPARSLCAEVSPINRRTSTHGILITRHISVSNHATACLRGGASVSDDGHNRRDNNDNGSNKILKRFLLGGKPPPLPSHQRPSAGLWWLAGGRLGSGRMVPTAGELRARREVEERNGEVVGFWGTVVGVRAVRRVRRCECEVSDDEEKSEGGEEAGVGEKGELLGL